MTRLSGMTVEQINDWLETHSCRVKFEAGTPLNYCGAMPCRALLTCWLLLLTGFLAALLIRVGAIIYLNYVHMLVVLIDLFFIVLMFYL